MAHRSSVPNLDFDECYFNDVMINFEEFQVRSEKFANALLEVFQNFFSLSYTCIIVILDLFVLPVPGCPGENMKIGGFIIPVFTYH